jgi:dihydropteroate synthase
MAAIGVHPHGVEIMLGKAGGFAVKLESLSAAEALILKQEALAAGADAAIARGIVSREVDTTDAVVLATRSRLDALAGKLSEQPFGLPAIGKALLRTVDNYQKDTYQIPAAHGTILDVSRPVVMGVLNVTPDSFSDGGRFIEPENALEHALQMAEQGAAVIDVGGQSTRPGSEPVGADEELGRVIPVITALRERSGVPISIDTTSAAVAREAIEAGANIINDVSAFAFDDNMPEVAARTGAAVVLMHMKGAPRDMQDAPEYDDLMGEVAHFLREAASRAVEAGVKRERIIIDPGIGFGKTLGHNLALMGRLDELRSLGYPVLAGPSRKSWLGMLLGAGVGERLTGTVAAVAALVMRGVSVIRVHDVAEAMQAVRISEAILKGHPDEGTET